MIAIGLSLFAIGAILMRVYGVSYVEFKYRGKTNTADKVATVFLLLGFVVFVVGFLKFLWIYLP